MRRPTTVIIIIIIRVCTDRTGRVARPIRPGNAIRLLRDFVPSPLERVVRLGETDDTTCHRRRAIPQQSSATGGGGFDNRLQSANLLMYICYRTGATIRNN